MNGILHMYSQADDKSDAHIVGDLTGLLELRHALDEAIRRFGGSAAPTNVILGGRKVETVLTHEAVHVDGGRYRVRICWAPGPMIDRLQRPEIHERCGAHQGKDHPSTLVPPGQLHERGWNGRADDSPPAAAE